MILAIILGLLNAIRGAGVWERDWWLMLMACSICYCMPLVITHQMMLVPVVFLLLLIGFVPGWGKYFNMAYTNMAYINETECKPIDFICDKTLGKPQTEKQFKIWCFLAMSIRGVLFYPLFIFLSVFNAYSLLYGLCVFSMGVIYYLRKYTPEKYSIRCSEFAYLFILGAFIFEILTIN